MNNKLVIFDYDGVLIDSEYFGCKLWVDELLKYCNITLEQMYGYTGRCGTQIIKGISKDFNCTIPDGFLEHVEKITEEKLESKAVAVKGVMETLPLIKNKMCIASGSKPSRLLQCINVLKMNKFFDINYNVFSATLVEHGKPAPDIFLYSAKNMGFNPKDCIVVEDSPVGVKAGKAAGMYVVGFNGASHATEKRKKELIDAGCDVIIEDFTKLIEILK